MGAPVEIGNKTLLLFDGVCNLCNGAVNFIIDRDHNQQFVFASLQSSLGIQIAAEHKLPENDFESMILFKQNKIFLKSDAALEIVKELSGGWKFLYVFKIVPQIIRNWFYELISANRYKWFGRQNQCRMPSNDIQDRFVSV